MSQPHRPPCWAQEAEGLAGRAGGLLWAAVVETAGRSVAEPRPGQRGARGAAPAVGGPGQVAEPTARVDFGPQPRPLPETHSQRRPRLRGCAACAGGRREQRADVSAQGSPHGPKQRPPRAKGSTAHEGEGRLPARRTDSFCSSATAGQSESHRACDSGGMGAPREPRAV